ncbi:MAG: homoserine dehydrogenase [Acidimicrobiaceae bacterium]|nr:homoserine dehydrogenase [Acidimicrobiaceae bacterium]|tara:strand:- start:231 stop:1514 length:1284 start_codon:yes stop_codon:yes gene_type:complete
MEVTTIRVGVLGYGNVGKALVDLIAEQREVISARTGLDLTVDAIAVRNPEKYINCDIDPEIITDNAHDVVHSKNIDVVVEVIGGVDPSKNLVLAALNSGKPVVTANKELLAKYGPELFACADGQGLDLLFEAAVAGGVPLMRVLRESLKGEPISRVMGIVNGTTNYILSKMTETGMSYMDALGEAQEKGFAESDPRADVEGQDAASKAAIIAMVAFGVQLGLDDVVYEGITEVNEADILFAQRFEHTIKLLAIAEQCQSEIGVRVHPVMLPNHHPLASVRDSFNAVFVEGEAVGDLMLYGRGAGGEPTASAVLGDLIAAANNLTQNTKNGLGNLHTAALQSSDELESAYYINLEVSDEPGVLASVASVFGKHGVSIRSMEQEGLGEEARIVFITHSSKERNVRSTLDELSELSCVVEIGTKIRVMGS